MNYEGMIIRPPSEAGSLLLQVTVGCSHNRCTFCPTYKEKKFRIKSSDVVMKDIQEASRYRHVKRLFLCDGDALIIPQARLLALFRDINDNLRDLERIGTYANAKSILRKSAEELTQLREMGLGIVYLGIESGNENILQKISKGANYQQLVEAGRRVKQAGISLSVTVLLGIGGIENSIEHAIDTARILTDIDPDYAGALTVMIVPGTPLHEEYMRGGFVLPDKFGFLRELMLIISNSAFSKCFFTSNHASNYLPIRANLPGEKEAVVQMISAIIEKGDKEKLRPEFMRGL